VGKFCHPAGQSGSGVGGLCLFWEWQWTCVLFGPVGFYARGPSFAIESDLEKKYIKTCFFIFWKKSL